MPEAIPARSADTALDAERVPKYHTSGIVPLAGAQKAFAKMRSAAPGCQGKRIRYYSASAALWY
jgi:hypothetical protein